jgi:hypothetical protein
MYLWRSTCSQGGMLRLRQSHDQNTSNWLEPGWVLGPRGNIDRLLSRTHEGSRAILPLHDGLPG